MGLDALWYLIALTSVGSVPVPLVLAFLAWGAAAAQVGAVVARRYAPYPEAAERSRGPIREATRQGILVWRRSRKRHLRAVESGDPDSEAKSAEG